MLQLLLMWIPFVFALGVLVYASIFDFRRREVSNWLWIFAYPTGCVMTLAGLVFNLLEVQTVLVSFLVSMFLGVVLLYFGFYGGADVKALIFVGLTLPMFPLMFNSVLSVPVLPLVLVVFCNSTLLSMVWPLSIFLLNLKDALKRKNMFEEINLTIPQKFLLLFTARKVALEQLEGFRYFPSEKVVLEDGKPKRELLHLMKAETDLSKYTSNLKENKELYQNGVLASPTIPSIVFFTVGLATAPIGTLLFWITHFLQISRYITC